MIRRLARWCDDHLVEAHAAECLGNVSNQLAHIGHGRRDRCGVKGSARSVYGSLQDFDAGDEGVEDGFVSHNGLAASRNSVGNRASAHERFRAAECANRRAVLAEPLAVVLHALSQFRDSFDGLRVLVCGSGPIGLLAVVALTRRGVASVAVTDLHERPLDVALRVGASETVRIDLGESPAPDAFDLVIEATGVPASLNAALAAVRPGGTIIQLGMLSRDGVTADLGTFVIKEVALLGTHRFAGELDDAISLLADAPECDSIVTDSVELARVSEAFRREGDPVNSSKALVEVSAHPHVYTDQLFSG